MLRIRRGFEISESRQLDHLKVFHDVARTLTTSLNLEEILRLIMEKMANFFGPERWSLLMVDEKRGDLYYAIAVGEDAKSLKGLRVAMGQGVAGWVASSGNPLIVPDVEEDGQWGPFARAHPELNIQSIACVPIQQDEKTLGVIQLLNSKQDLLSEYSISFLRILCDYAAIAIQNARSMTLIQQLTITDDCTNLFNARHLYQTLESAVAARERGRRVPFGLLFLDLDRFKSVNDTHGHLVGSRLLSEIGDLLRRVIGPENLAFRYGGDEFVMVLPGMGREASLELTLQLREELRAATFLTGESLALQVTGSFGLATYPADGLTVHGVMKAADTMMYEVKNTTRDNVAVYGVGVVTEHAAPSPGAALHVVTRG